jgi:hypothetical protein
VEMKESGSFCFDELTLHGLKKKRMRPFWISCLKIQRINNVYSLLYVVDNTCRALVPSDVDGISVSKRAFFQGFLHVLFLRLPSSLLCSQECRSRLLSVG